MTRTFLVRFAVAAVLALLIAVMIASRPVAAATLRAAVTVEADVVTLGDLFEGAGAAAGRPVFRSPDPGVDGALPAAAAIAAATAAGLPVDPTAIASVHVVRRSVTVSADDLAALVAQTVASRLQAAADDIDVVFDSIPAAVPAVLGPDAPARVETLTYAARSGRFRAIVAVEAGSQQHALDLSGTAVATVPVAVLVRPVARGQTITAADVASERRPRQRVEAAALRDPSDLVGMAARRPLKAGDMVTAQAVEPPRIVRRGELVTLHYETPGLALTARGRALSDAAAGEVVSVLNEQSRRTIEGVAAGEGTVRIPAGALRTAGVARPRTIQ